MNKVTYATRRLFKDAGFTATVIVLLALGIGGSVSIFSIVNATLLHPLPYSDPDRLVLLFGNIQRAAVERRGTSLPDYRDWRKQNRSFEGMAAFWNRTFVMRGSDEQVPIDGEVVGAEYFDLLRVKPVLGRAFHPQEETDAGLTPVAILGYEFWEQRMASDPSVLGKPLTLSSTRYTIVGVMPKGFRGIRDDAQLWVTPASLPPPEQNFNDRGSRGLNVLGRLRTGVHLSQAQLEMDGISRSLAELYPDTNEKRGVELVPLAAETFGNVRPALLAMLGAVGLVFLIAGANAANLMVLRTEARQREIAIRMAIGASRRELVKELLAETVILSLGGSILGFLVSGWVVELILAISPIQLPSFVTITSDLNVLIFAGILALVTSLLMAVGPALQFRISDLQQALVRSSDRTTGALSSGRVRHALVIGEIALSFILLLASVLLIESFRNLLRVDTGFETSHLLTLRLAFDGGSSTKAEAVLESIKRLPCVQSAALSSVIPYSGGGAVFFAAEGEEPLRDATTAPRAYIHFVTSNFFQTMGVPLRYGRALTATEADTSVVVNERLVRRFWPNQDPIGKRIRIGRDNFENPWLKIVGVVGDTKTRGIPDNPTADPDIYFPFKMFGGSPGMLVRTQGDSSGLIPSVLREIKKVDKLATISNVVTVEDLLRRRTAGPRFLSFLSGMFSGLALLLALAGIYGAMSYFVAQKTREIGIRVALGAGRGSLFRLVLGRCLVLIAAGIGLGLLGGFLVGKGMTALLFGVSATTGSVFLLVTSLMILTGLCAAYIPARHATQINPLRALRQE